MNCLHLSLFSFLLSTAFIGTTTSLLILYNWQAQGVQGRDVAGCVALVWEVHCGVAVACYSAPVPGPVCCETVGALSVL